jgi:peptidoglycan hydrolase-like protein with peptidoglycan-binding domain/3D (Asp-Asp-Asp) domain-containing protein
MIVKTKQFRFKIAAVAILNIAAMMGMMINVPIVNAQDVSDQVILPADTDPASDENDPPVPQTLTSGELHVQNLDFNPAPVSDATAGFPYNRTFIISAYYSPLLGQNKYVTGSYRGDIRLNGGGVHGADGTNVYPGMIAAPKGYDFGTKMAIPGLGTVAVHDRGGAIVHSGVRKNAYDRLDVWMGYGDAGLTRAMKWGKRTVNVAVLGFDASIKEGIALNGYSINEKLVVNNSLTPNADSKNPSASVSVNTIMAASSTRLGPVAFGTKNEKVKQMQESLKKLNFYEGEINSTFDENTRKALAKFQVSENIVAHSLAYGAGFAGPKTIKILAGKMEVIKAHAEEEKYTPNTVFNIDLKYGDSGSEVRKLQQELIGMHLLGVETTGYFGEVTAHAVFKFQQTNSIVTDKDSGDAGLFGAKTRATLNDIISTRLRTEKMIADRKKDDSSLNN